MMAGHARPSYFPTSSFSGSHGSAAKSGKKTNTQNCKHGTEDTFMVFGVFKVSWCLQFFVAWRNHQKNICFTNAYLPSALLCESRFPELLSLMGKTGNASFEEKTKTTFLCSPGPGPCPWSYTNMFHFNKNESRFLSLEISYHDFCPCNLMDFGWYVCMQCNVM